MLGTCECGNEPSGSIKCGKFLDLYFTKYFSGDKIEKDEMGGA